VKGLPLSSQVDILPLGFVGGCDAIDSEAAHHQKIPQPTDNAEGFKPIFDKYFNRTTHKPCQP